MRCILINTETAPQQFDLDLAFGFLVIKQRAVILFIQPVLTSNQLTKLLK